jgi:hypothetical protein
VSKSSISDSNLVAIEHGKLANAFEMRKGNISDQAATGHAKKSQPLEVHKVGVHDGDGAARG